MTSLNSLVQQPQSPQPPQQQGASGTGDVTSLQALMQQRQGGPQDGAQPGTAAGPPAPDRASTVAALRHIAAFDKRWKEMLADPGIGTKNVRSQFLDGIADLMGEGFMSLTQSLTLLKSFPNTPLEQKQWLAKHAEDDEKAMGMLLSHHAAANPAGPGWPNDETAPLDQMAQQGPARDHLAMMGALADHYRARSPKKPIKANA